MARQQTEPTTNLKYTPGTLETVSPSAKLCNRKNITQNVCVFSVEKEKINEW